MFWLLLATAPLLSILATLQLNLATVLLLQAKIYLLLALVFALFNYIFENCCYSSASLVTLFTFSFLLATISFAAFSCCFLLQELF